MKFSKAYLMHRNNSGAKKVDDGDNSTGWKETSRLLVFAP